MGCLHPNNEWRLLDQREIAARWHGREEGLRESLRVAEECTGFTFDWMRPPLPDFRKAKLSAGMSDRNDDEALRVWTEEGMRERWGEPTYEQRQQIQHELELIARLGFSGFFLVMADAVRFARHKGILCQGRGSAANSAVAFCLAITAVDPVKNGLLFERFLSDARVNGRAEPPDIDVDFEHNRREEVLDYMYDNYAREHAAITAVSQCFHAPTAVQDAMRALGYPAEQIFEISKRVHGGDPSGSVAEIPMIADARGVDVSGARGRALLDALPGFDGLVRLRSTHVGGFVLSAQPLGNYLPVEQTTMGRTIVQFDKDDLDMIGVPKFDFLGLGALAMVRIAFDVMEARTGKRPNMYEFEDRDAKTYDLIQRGETIGTFQIESRAQINSILHTKPDHLYDLVVQVALIRPGPIQAAFVHPYTERRLGKAPVEYAHPDLAEVLSRTQGIPIFQEQAMAIAMKLGGYTATQADLLRRTMGNIRKKGRLEAALRDLKQAMQRRDIDEAVAEKICQDLVSFANYGFPESHAWSFALIAYVTAYLKAHHPMEFFVGLLNAQPMGFYPISTLVHDAKRHGVEVRPPCLGARKLGMHGRVARDARRVEVRARDRRQGDRRLESRGAVYVHRGRRATREADASGGVGVRAGGRVRGVGARPPARRVGGPARVRRRPPARAGDGELSRAGADRSQSVRASRLSRRRHEHLWTSDGVRARAAQARRRDRQQGARDDAQRQDGDGGRIGDGAPASRDGRRDDFSVVGG